MIFSLSVDLQQNLKYLEKVILGGYFLFRFFCREDLPQCMDASVLKAAHGALLMRWRWPALASALPVSSDCKSSALESWDLHQMMVAIIIFSTMIV